jgi:hypothetical protein
MGDKLTVEGEMKRIFFDEELSHHNAIQEKLAIALIKTQILVKTSVKLVNRCSYALLSQVSRRGFKIKGD